MRNVSNKSYRENQDTHFMFNNQDKDTSKDEVGTEYKIILKKILLGAWISVC
jgi:hypothetical protein